jgi:curved DNA-binding protein CbpA
MSERLDSEPFDSYHFDPQPFDPEHPDFYRVLNVSRQATLVEIKQSFRRLARQYHPDLHPNEAEAAARFKQISAAYDVLSDRQRRQDYDASLAAEPDTAGPKPESFQVHYQRGLDNLALRDYTAAVAAFDRAIQLNPDLIEAYLGRCSANEELKNDRAILEDCYRLLQIDPQLAPAYYHQGRARYRLGYLQGAVEAYTHAITLRDTFALAYYQRGRILLELKDTDRARQDLQRASRLFRVQDDLEQYRQAEALLNSLGSYRARSKFRFESGLPRVLTEAIRNIPALLLNPSANLQPVFARLSPIHAVWTGLLYGSVASISMVIAGILLSHLGAVHGVGLALAVGRFYAGLVLTGVGVQQVVQGRVSWPQSCFLAGVAALPIAVLALLSGLSLWLPWILPVLAVLTSCYSVIYLYVGYSQLSKMAESAIIVAVPLMLMTSTAVAIAFLN